MMGEGAKYRQCPRFGGLIRNPADDKQNEHYETNWKVDVETPL